MAKVTMDMVAARAGVSKTAVSYVLSGKKKVYPNIEEKILKAVEELGYKRRISTPKLTSKMKVIALCIPFQKADEFIRKPISFPS